MLVHPFYDCSLRLVSLPPPHLVSLVARGIFPCCFWSKCCPSSSWCYFSFVSPFLASGLPSLPSSSSFSSSSFHLRFFFLSLCHVSSSSFLVSCSPFFTLSSGFFLFSAPFLPLFPCSASFFSFLFLLRSLFLSVFFSCLSS